MREGAAGHDAEPWDTGAENPVWPPSDVPGEVPGVDLSALMMLGPHPGAIAPAPKRPRPALRGSFRAAGLRGCCW
jgi:hypothetical protein